MSILTWYKLAIKDEQDPIDAFWNKGEKFGSVSKAGCGSLPAMSTPNRVVKTELPARVIVSAVLIGLLVVGFILFAVWQSGRGITQARMRGVIVSKEFRPSPEPERQITLNRSGTVSAQVSDGEYLITVEVPQKDGSKKTYNVWLNDKRRYDAVKPGDAFDVGPYLVPSQ